VDDTCALLFQARRGGHHVHDHERRNIAAGRGQDQPFGVVEHQRATAALLPQLPLL